MTNLITLANSEAFDNLSISHCDVHLSFLLEDGTALTIESRLIPGSRGRLKTFLEGFYEARKFLEEELVEGNDIEKFIVSYSCMDKSDNRKVRQLIIRPGSPSEGRDPIAAAKEVSDWVKHTLLYV